MTEIICPACDQIVTVGVFNEIHEHADESGCLCQFSNWPVPLALARARREREKAEAKPLCAYCNEHIALDMWGKFLQHGHLDGKNDCKGSYLTPDEVWIEAFSEFCEKDLA